LPGLNAEEYAVSEFTVDCAVPQLNRNLHLLVIGTEEKDGKGLIERVLRSLGAEQTGVGAFKTGGGFEQGILERPLLGDVYPTYVATQLDFLKEQLQQRARAGFPHDVVLIYFQGGEATDARGDFLALTSGR